MTYAFLIALALGALAGGIFAAMWQGAKGALIKEKADHAKTAADLAALATGLKLSEAGRGDEKARLESLVNQLKKEIASLEASAPHDPSAVRDRLRVLLGGLQDPLPVSKPSAGVGPLGLMPFGSSTKP